jgi:hypothetical protein
VIQVPAFVVIGGGRNGAYVVRQLLRAAAASALETDRLIVVDRDPAGLAFLPEDPRLEPACADWGEWLDEHLLDLPEDAHVVPYHWAPHLFLEWLSREVERAGGRAQRGPAPTPPPGVPYARDSGPADLALSYATWICPATCIEPVLCPHTRGAKDWSLCADLERAADEAIVFRCLHLVYGVGTVPVARLQEARARVLTGLTEGPRRFLVATSSHCHALAASLHVRGGRGSETRERF